jgi:AAA+ superfamily predicted ATPase
MNTLIKLNIPKTSSSNLSKVLANARTFEEFIEPTEKHQPYQLHVGPQELCKRHQDLEQLYLMARNWKGLQLLINGRLADMLNLRIALLIFKCADKRSNAVIPENFCQPKHAHGWGCKHQIIIRGGVPESVYELDKEYGYWFQFGTFTEGHHSWIIDKSKLLTALKKEVAGRYIDLCPYFDMANIEERVNALPDRIEFNEASSWDIQYEEKFDNSTIQKVPIGIIPKKFENRHNARLSLSIKDDGPEENNECSQNRNIPMVAFGDIGGVDEIIGMVREVIELPLRHPILFKHLGIAPHKGILLYGPPGCGKTLIARAIANEIKAHFISIRGPELFTKWFGESESNLRGLFMEARKFAPSVIFFDEIDAIAQKRSGEETIRNESIFVNQLLTLMDGMETYENVCVIASTNRPELLDEALMRPGRFDYTLEIKHPSLEGCRKIFLIHTRNMPLSPTVDLDQIALKMKGFTGADIAFVAREGAYNCLRRCGDVTGLISKAETEITLENYVVQQEDFEKALKVILENHLKAE